MTANAPARATTRSARLQSTGSAANEKPRWARADGRGVRLLCCIGALLFGLADPSAAETIDETLDAMIESEHLTGDLGGLRSTWEEHGVAFDVAYTSDYIYNTRGGLQTGGAYLGNLDMTLRLDTWQLTPWDLGTVFTYGLVDFGGKPSSLVGDSQGVDNIEAPTDAKLYELWWQRSFFRNRFSVLAGLYDMNSEFYVVESAEIFVHSSFGMGPCLGLSGDNGPSTFPNTSLSVRLKAEPIDSFTVSTAIMDGVPGNPNGNSGTEIQFDRGDGVFFIAQVSKYWPRDPEATLSGSPDPATRRRIGRTIDQSPNLAKLTLGTWLYSKELIALADTATSGQQVEQRGHPGLYLLAEVDASLFFPIRTEGLAAFAQLGWGDGAVEQFVGYSGFGLVYTGIIPARPDDSLGLGAAIAYNGKGYDTAARVAGDAPAFGEAALELTYRAHPMGWLSLQGDLQYVINPGGLSNRPNAVVAGFRFVVDL